MNFSTSRAIVAPATRVRLAAVLAALATVVGSLVTGATARGATAPTPTWTAATTLTPDGQSDPGLDNDRIDVAMGSDGDAAVAWLSGMPTSSGPGTVSVGYRAGEADATWEVHAITSGATAISEPRVAVAANGDAVVAWNQTDGLYAAYRPAGVGQGWTSPQQVVPSADYAQCGYDNCPVWGFSIAIDPSGNAIAAWSEPTRSQEGAGSPEVAYRATGMTSTWSGPQSMTLPTGIYGGSTPQVKFDAQGNALAVLDGCGYNGLSCYTGASWGIYYYDRPAEASGFGTNGFGAPATLLDNSTGTSEAPSLDLAEGPDGSAALAWTCYRCSSYLAYRPSGQASFDAPAQGDYGTVSVDPAGEAFAVNGQSRYSAGADYYHAAGAGESWTQVDTGPFVYEGDWYDDQYAPADVALDSTGQAVVVGVETDEITYSDNAVAAVRGTDGTWSALKQLNDTAGDPASNQRVATDAQGDATAAWVEDVNGLDVVRVAGLVGSPALTSLSVPSTVIQGYPATFSVVPRDVWQAISDSDVTWTFTNESNPTDSVTDTGTTISHAFSTLGVYDVTVSATDAAGQTVTSAVQKITVSTPDASLDADATSGVAPLTVTLDASRSVAPPNATFTFYCGDSDQPAAPASTTQTATCTYDRESPDGGWGAHVVMHDPATGKDYQASLPITVAPHPDTVDDSAAFDAANADGDITVASDGSLVSDSTIDGAEIRLAAGPGTFAAGTHVLIYHGDPATLQSELGSDVQDQGGFAITWTPRTTLDPGKPLIVTIPTGTSTQLKPALTMRPALTLRPALSFADLGSFFSGAYNGFVSAASTVVTTISTGLSDIATAVGSWWHSSTQTLTKPNGLSTNNVLYCGKIDIPSSPSPSNPITCEGGFTVVQDVPTDRVADLTAGGGFITAGGGNIITAGGGNIITAGGGNIITAGGGNIITAGGGNLITAGGGNLITAGGGNFITAGGGNFISVGGGNLTFGLTNDPGIAFVQPTSTAPPTVTATPDPAVPAGGVYGAGPVTVHLHATAADGATVKNVSYSASGAQQILNTDVAGSDADVVVDQPGSTTITYAASDNSLNQTAPQTITIDIATAPTAPSITGVTAGDGQAVVAFDPPASDGGSPVVSYTVTAAPAGGGSPVSGRATGSPFTLTGLTDGVTYAVTVTATNVAGTSPASSSVSVTPFAPVSVPGPTGLQDVVSATSTGSGASATADSSTAYGDIKATGVGAGTISVGRYVAQPASTAATTFQSAGSFADVFTAAGSSFSSVDIVDCALGAGGRALYWWDAADGGWRLVQPEHFTAGPPACVSATLDSTSSPSVDELGGTVFASAVPVAPMLSSVTPSRLVRGRAGTLTLHGSGFQPGASVQFGDGHAVRTSASPTVAADGSTVSVAVSVVPDAAAGPVAVTVTNPDSGWVTCGSCASVVATPVVSVRPLPQVVDAGHVQLHYDGSETGGGITGFDVRSSRAAYDARRFSPWSSVSTMVTSRRLAIQPGQTVCLSVRARDTYAQASSWSPTQCVTRPLPVGHARASRQWTARHRAAYFAGTALVSRGAGASIRLPHARFDQVGLVMSTCRACGDVRLGVGTDPLGTMSLHSSRGQASVVRLLASSARRHGTLVVTTLHAKKVAIQGLVLIRHRGKPMTAKPALSRWGLPTRLW